MGQVCSRKDDEDAFQRLDTPQQDKDMLCCSRTPDGNYKVNPRVVRTLKSTQDGLQEQRDALNSSVDQMKDQMSAENIQKQLKEQAEKLLTDEQRMYIAKVRKFQEDPLEAAIDEVEPLIPEDKKEEFKIAKQMAIDHIKDQKEGKQIENVCPVTTLLKNSEKFVTDEDHKAKIAIAIILVDKSLTFEKKLEALLPEEHKPKFRTYFEMCEKVNQKAQALKKQKDEMQLKLITKAVDSQWKKKDKENLGTLSKAVCSEMVQDALTQIGQQKLFDSSTFEFAFDLIIVAADIAFGVLTKEDLQKAYQEVVEQMKSEAQAVINKSVEEVKNQVADKVEEAKNDAKDGKVPTVPTNLDDVKLPELDLEQMKGQAMNLASDELKGALKKLSSGVIKKDQVVQLINQIINAYSPV